MKKSMMSACFVGALWFGPVEPPAFGQVGTMQITGIPDVASGQEEGLSKVERERPRRTGVDLSDVIGSIIGGLEHHHHHHNDTPHHRPRRVRPYPLQSLHMPLQIWPRPQATYRRPLYSQPLVNELPPRRPTPTPTSTWIAPPAPPAPPKATPPVVTAHTLRNEISPVLTGMKMLNEKQLESAEKAIENDIDKDMDDLAVLADGIPDAEALLEDLDAYRKAGKSVPTNWIDKFEDALKAGGKSSGEIKKIHDKYLTTLPGKVAAANLMKKALDAVGSGGILGGGGVLGGGLGGGGLGIPTGPVVVLVMPLLSDGSIYIIPGVGLMVGTGGVGSIGTMTKDASDVLGVPLGSGTPVPDVTFDPAANNTAGVLLRNPEENGAPVRYSVDSRWNYTLQPGYTQQLDGQQTRRIRFSRGAGAGAATYGLTEGSYAFGPSDKGWDLYQESFEVTIDNSESDQEFRYVVDNRQCKVQPRGTRTHKSNFPIVVRFNRGAAGKEAVKEILGESNHLMVAVNPADGLWDLYPGDSMGEAPFIAAPGSEPNVPAPPKRDPRLLSSVESSL